MLLILLPTIITGRGHFINSMCSRPTILSFPLGIRMGAEIGESSLYGRPN